MLTLKKFSSTLTSNKKILSGISVNCSNLQGTLKLLYFNN